MPNTDSQSDAKLKAAVELLGDNDEMVASMALDTIFKSDKLCDVLVNAQDSNDENVRRRAQQLSSMFQQQALLEHTVTEYEQARLDILDAVINIDLLYDTSSSIFFLHEQVKKLSDALKTKRKIAIFDELLGYMERSGYYVPPLPWLSIEEYLIGDVLTGDGAGTPIILAILAQSTGRRHGCEIAIALCNGFISIINDASICILENGWTSRPIDKKDEICVLNPQQLLRLYLSQLVASSIATWEAYDTHLFMEIFKLILGIKNDPLPYPFGDAFAPEKK